LKKLLSVILLGVALFTFAIQRPALAGDAAKGAQIFGANCAACHLNGNNVVMPTKTLKKADLEKYLQGYGDDAEAAIAYQVTKGKNAMPAFLGRLSPQDIEDVAAYVATQAEKGW